MLTKIFIKYTLICLMLSEFVLFLATFVVYINTILVLASLYDCSHFCSIYTLGQSCQSWNLKIGPQDVACGFMILGRASHVIAAPHVCGGGAKTQHCKHLLCMREAQVWSLGIPSRVEKPSLVNKHISTGPIDRISIEQLHMFKQRGSCSLQHFSVFNIKLAQ